MTMKCMCTVFDVWRADPVPDPSSILFADEINLDALSAQCPHVLPPVPVY